MALRPVASPSSAGTDRPAPPELAAAEPRPRRWGHELGALVLMAVAAFLLLALLTLRADPQDPSVTGANWAGPAGAAIGGLLSQGFGVIAWLVPVELVLIALPLIRGREDELMGYRVAGDLLIAIVLSALVQVAAPEAVAFGAQPAAGNVGFLFGELARGLFSSLGSFLVGATLISSLLVSRNQLSFIELCRRTASLSARVSEGAVAGGWRVAGAWEEARRLRKEEVAAERAAAEPRIGKPSDDAIIAQLDDAGAGADDAPVSSEEPPVVSVAASLRDRRVNGARLADLGAPSFGPDSEPSLTELVTSEPEETPKRPRVRKPRPAKGTDASANESKPARQTPTAQPTQPSGSTAPVPGAPHVLTRSAAEAPLECGVAEEPFAPAVELPEPEPEPEPAALRIVDTRPAQLTLPTVPTERARALATRDAEFRLPDTALLSPAASDAPEIDRDRILENARLLEKTLGDYGVSGKVEEVHPGPTVTTYEFSPQAGTKVSKVAGLADDLALGLSRKVRIVAPIPGKARIGFEIPNDERVPVSLRELVEDERFVKLAKKAPLPVVLGRDIVGAPFYGDLASMPHVIVAGATGAGKSVGLNVMLSSLLFCRTPADLRFLMVDPKVVELAPFDGIPHMLLPVVTDMKQAATALRWAVDEMERRYQLFANAGTKNIGTYNGWVERARAGEVDLKGPETVTAIDANGYEVELPAARAGADGKPLPEKIPFIVVVVDEFADLIMQQGKEVETSIARLAQKARAAGMHVVLATQRPSVDVITGMIKANFPSRIAYRVAQRVDSRTILDEQGAEMLLGRGDMLVKLNGSSDTRRVQCPFVSEEEVASLTDMLRAQGAPTYNEDILREADEGEEEPVDDEKTDARFEEAVRIVAETQRCSTSWLQRKMTIGYNRAAKIVELMERRGFVGPPNGSKDREVFLPPP